MSIYIRDQYIENTVESPTHTGEAQATSEHQEDIKLTEAEELVGEIEDPQRRHSRRLSIRSVWDSIKSVRKDRKSLSSSESSSPIEAPSPTRDELLKKDTEDGAFCECVIGLMTRQGRFPQVSHRRHRQEGN